MDTTKKRGPQQALEVLRQAGMRVRSPEVKKNMYEDDRFEMIVGQVGSVSNINDKIVMTFLPYNVEVGEDIVEHWPITPAQAFLLGTALLQLAKQYGVH